jgi:periodic tryptophan protein 1
LGATESEINGDDKDMSDDGSGDEKKEKKEKKAETKKPAAAADVDPEIEKFMAQLKMDEYDSGDEGGGASIFDAPGKHAEFESNAQDPYMTVGDVDDPDADDDSHAVAPTDSLICVGHSEKEEHNLRVYLFDEKTSSLFVHHDYPLPFFPLCVQFLDCGPQTGRYRSPTHNHTPLPFPLPHLFPLLLLYL